jgi:hypothetical protein
MTWKNGYGWVAAAVLAGAVGVGHGQTASLPATPVPQVPQAPSDAENPNPKADEPVVNEAGKIVLVQPIPEPAAGDAFFSPLATGGPETLSRRFKDYYYVAFGPRALITPAISAAIRQAFPNTNYPEDWQTGAGAFGRNYGSAVGTKVAGQTARFAVGAALHEDFRYRPTWGMGPAQQTKAGEYVRVRTRGMPVSDKSVGYRIFYAIGFAFVDRSDSGGKRLAVANFSEAAASGFVGNLWLPDGFNDARHGAQRMGSRFGSIAVQNVTREFSPEIFHLFEKLHLPFPRLPVPEWWDGTMRKGREQGLGSSGVPASKNDNS